MTESPDVPSANALDVLSVNVPDDDLIAIGTDDEADEQRVAERWAEAEAAGTLGVTAAPDAGDPRWTGPDGHAHTVRDHEPGSWQHHGDGIPHHH